METTPLQLQFNINKLFDIRNRHFLKRRILSQKKKNRKKAQKGKKK